MTINIHYSINEIARICGATWINKNEAVPDPKYLSLDSRKINSPAATVFFALKSSAQNVQMFVSQLYQKGVRHFVIDKNISEQEKFPDANILRVDDTVKALQALAEWHRMDMMKIPVIGITGSNGKTVVKEWLNHLLAEKYSIVRSPRSYNSQIGVPLSILNMLTENTLGIFEAGISLPDEMGNLEKIIQPKIGIFTNIGNAHDEGFISQKQKIQEKLILFQRAELLIFCSDKENITKEIHTFQRSHPELALLKWGHNPASDIRITDIQQIVSDAPVSKISGMIGKNPFSINIPFTDDGSIENAMHCLCCIIALNEYNSSVLKRFETLEPLAMRLELKPAINDCTIINDSYSNDLQSLRIALDFLSQQKQHKKKTVIFSDIIQSGTDQRLLYRQVADLLHGHHIHKLIGIGPQISANTEAFESIEKAIFFEHTEDFLKNIQLHHFQHESILIKGARKFGFEKITRLLETKIHQTVLSINLDRLVHNFKEYKSRLKPRTKMMIMVKASGYGTGSHEIASVLEYNNAEYLAVAYTDEGVELRNAGISLPIMVMNVDESALDLITNFNLQPEIFSFDILNAFLAYLRANDMEDYPIHLKIDTGMHRLGFTEDEIPVLAKMLKNNTFVKVESAFSHLAASDEAAKDEFTRSQFQVFERCAMELEKALQYPFLKHIANTSAISRFPEMQLDMVRLGIGLFGIDSNLAMQADLQNVSVLKTTVSQIKHIPAGDTVGYGRSGQILKDSTIATVRIGYADGYPRILGNGKGKMLIGNQLVPVIGNVCMDMTMLDITGLDNVYAGDEVTVFGDSPTLAMVAEWADTIPYEIMTGISQRVKRVYFEE